MEREKGSKDQSIDGKFKSGRGEEEEEERKSGEWKLTGEWRWRVESGELYSPAVQCTPYSTIQTIIQYRKQESAQVAIKRQGYNKCG